MTDANDIGGETKPDATAAFKAEYDKKLSQYDSKISELARANELLMSQLKQTQAKPEPQVDDDKFDDIWFKNPKEAARLIEERTYTRAKKEVESTLERERRQNQVLGSLVADYPELNNNEHDLTRRAVEVFNTFSADERSNPAYYKQAVLQAASEMGIRPKAKRPKQDDADDFVMGSRSSVQSRRKASGELDEATLEFARALGMDTDNPDYIARLKKTANDDAPNQWMSMKRRRS